VEAYNATLKVHDTLAQNRLKFAQRLIDMSEELMNLAKEGERLRKVVSRHLLGAICADAVADPVFYCSTKRQAVFTRRVYRKQSL
jgi:hypothetical protein